MSTSMKVSQALPLSIEFDDPSGGIISPPPAPDATPVWTLSDSTLAGLSPAPDGLTAVLSAVAAGTVTITLTLAVAGQPWTASLSVSIAAAVPVVGGVQIIAGTPA